MGLRDWFSGNQPSAPRADSSSLADTILRSGAPVRVMFSNPTVGVYDDTHHTAIVSGPAFLETNVDSDTGTIISIDTLNVLITVDDLLERLVNNSVTWLDLHVVSGNVEQVDANVTGQWLRWAQPTH